MYRFILGIKNVRYSYYLYNMIQSLQIRFYCVLQFFILTNPVR